MEAENTQDNQSNSERKKNHTEGIGISGFKMYCRATVIQMIWHWHKNRRIDQENE